MRKLAILGAVLPLLMTSVAANASSASTYHPAYAYEAAPQCMPAHGDYHLKGSKPICRSHLVDTHQARTHYFSSATTASIAVPHTSQPQLTVETPHTVLPVPKRKAYCYKGSKKRYDRNGRLIH